MIIDFHTHIFPDRVAESAVSSLAKRVSYAPDSDGTAGGLLSALSRAGADMAINLPVLTRRGQFESILAFAKEINGRDYEGQRILSFCGIHPHDESAEEHLYAIHEAGIQGIKIHPDYQGSFIDCEEYVRILGIAKSLGLITVTHAGLDAAFVGEEIKCTPRRVLNLLDKLGGYDRLVLAHLGGRALFDEVITNLAGLDIYFDTALVLLEVGQDKFERLLSRHGIDKILFATDSPWRDIETEVKRIKSYSLGSVTEEKIFSLNAKNLLGMDKVK